MPTMLLVEDETLERRSLINYIDWGLIGVSIVGEAGNGEQGLSLFYKMRPDIVLSDVSMPVMDGIEMARRIRSISPETRILFISAYDDFDYARQAIDLKVQAYIMKPVNENELLRAVKKAVDEIFEERLQSKSITTIKDNFSSSLDLAKNAIVNRFLAGVAVKPEDLFRLQLAWLGNGEGETTVLLSCFKPEITDKIVGDLDEINSKCSAVCEKQISIYVDRGKIVTILQSDFDKPSSAGNAEEVLRQCFSRENDEDIQIFKETVPSGQKEISDAYWRLRSKTYPAGTLSIPEPGRRNRQQIAEEAALICREQYAQPITVEIIAKALHFTPNYLGTVFKQVKQMSISRYLMIVRLEKACEMLLETDASVNLIAEKCGFGSITYFHTTFKKEYGLTPGEYRSKKAN